MSASTGPLAQLRLGPAGPDRWSGGAGAGADRIVAGLLGAQATGAAGRTVDTRSRWVHAVHVTHLAEGDPGAPVEHRVERTHDTEHAAVRLVRSVQGSPRSEEHTSELQSLRHLVCPLLLEKKKKRRRPPVTTRASGTSQS